MLKVTPLNSAYATDSMDKTLYFMRPAVIKDKRSEFDIYFVRIQLRWTLFRLFQLDLFRCNLLFNVAFFVAKITIFTEYLKFPS